MRAQLSLPLDGPMGAKQARRVASFFARSHMRLEEYEAGTARALGQEAAIVAWMREHPGRHAPSAVAAAFPQWPLTSTRRALTVATRKGLLVHWPGDRRPGPFGMSESVWTA